MMRLEFDEGFWTALKVWGSPTKGNMIIPHGDPPCYYKIWDLSEESVPETLYVEGIAPTYPKTDTLWLSYIAKDGPSIHFDTVKFGVVPMGVFRDASCSQVLDDWPEDGDQLRSPKYIFGEDDPIYVQVANLGTDPLEVETFTDVVWVTSESDTSDTVKLKLQETGPSTQKFRNLEELGELLYLSTSSSKGVKDKIEVIDEEVLTFWLEIQPGSDNYVTCKTVMVDRGEFLAVAGSECGDESGWDDFNMAISEAKSKMSNDYGWWENGYLEGKYYETRSDITTEDEEYEVSKENALDWGGVCDSSCADFSFYSGHGDDAELRIIIAQPDEINNHYFDVCWYSSVINPDRGCGWSDDKEFIVWSSCNLLGNAETPDQWVNRWIEVFFNKKLHAVLGTSDVIQLIAMNDDFGRFINRLKNGQTVVNAYKLACYQGWDSPYGILVRESNLNDYVLTPVSSAGQCLTRDYTNIDTTFYYFYYDLYFPKSATLSNEL